MTRTDIVAEARRWIGTPYLHQHRSRQVGVDCAGLIICVGRAVGAWPADFDVNGYLRTPIQNSLLSMCREHLAEISIDDAQPGDVLAVSMGGHPCHLGFLGDYEGGRLSLIHARQEQRGGVVVEHRLRRGGVMVPVAAFSLPGM